MYHDMIEFLRNKQNNSLTIKNIAWLLEQIIMHTHFSVTPEETREALETAIDAYDWLK